MGAGQKQHAQRRHRLSRRKTAERRILTMPKSTSKQIANRFSQATKIYRLSPEERSAIGFSSRMFVQASLPHTDPGNDLDVWVRRNGKAILTIQQGFRVGENNEVVKIGYPYGSTPRLILIYLASEAVKTKNPCIGLGGTMTEFLRRIGLPNDTHYIRMLKKQIVRLFSADIRFAFGNDKVVMGANGSIADKYLLWWDEKRAADPGQQHLWPNEVVLNQRFFDEIIQHGFPLDLDAIKGIKKSPLALDLYGFLAYRMNTVREDVFIPWASLHEQVGSDYTDIKGFKRRAKEALRLVRWFWPKLALKNADGGFVIQASPMPVAKSAGQQMKLGIPGPTA
jgi:hypothetical protein